MKKESEEADVNLYIIMQNQINPNFDKNKDEESYADSSDANS